MQVRCKTCGTTCVISRSFAHMASPDAVERPSITGCGTNLMNFPHCRTPVGAENQRRNGKHRSHNKMVGEPFPPVAFSYGSTAFIPKAFLTMSP